MDLPEGVKMPNWAIEIMQEYARQAVTYALKQAAEKGESKYKDGFGEVFRQSKASEFTEVDKSSILSLKEQILKDLKL